MPESEERKDIYLREDRLKKRSELISKDLNPYKYIFERTHSTAQLREEFSDADSKPSDFLEKAAGRVIASRDMGGVCFMDIEDFKGKIQIYVKKEDLSEEKRFLFEYVDIGDIIGVSGNVFKTKTGEISIKVSNFDILSKSLRRIPYSYYGLKDTETRYRYRYLDLAVNRESRDVFVTRSKIISEMRRWLDMRGFIEVETPILQPLYGGAMAKPFVTFHNFLNRDLYLRIAEELHLKRLIVGGFEKVYEIGKVFRNESIDPQHNPEFTILELYQAYADYKDMMTLTEEMIAHVVSETKGGQMMVEYQGVTLDFSPPWRRVSINDLLQERLGYTMGSVEDMRTARNLAREYNVDIQEDMSINEILFEIFEKIIQPELIQPTFAMDYPIENSPLAKAKRGDSSLVERFEAFAYGWEIANAFSELNDPVDQEARFIMQKEKRERGDMEAHPYDEDYVVALEYGKPPTGGLGVGVDRIVMLLTNALSIKDVILFPQLREEGGQDEM